MLSAMHSRLILTLVLVAVLSAGCSSSRSRGRTSEKSTHAPVFVTPSAELATRSASAPLTSASAANTALRFVRAIQKHDQAVVSSLRCTPSPTFMIPVGPSQALRADRVAPRPSGWSVTVGFYDGGRISESVNLLVRSVEGRYAVCPELRSKR